MLDKTKFNTSNDSVLEGFLEVLHTDFIGYKYCHFSIKEKDFKEYFGFNEEIPAEESVALFDYFQGDAEGLKIDKNPVDSYKKAKYLIFPIEKSYRPLYRTKFSVFKVGDNYYFSKHWEKYIPLIAHKKIIPVTFQNYYIKPVVELTIPVMDSLIQLLNSEDKLSKEIFKTMFLTINFKTKDEISIVLKCFLYHILSKLNKDAKWFASEEYSREVNRMIVDYVDSTIISDYTTYKSLEDLNRVYPELFIKYMKPIIITKMNELARIYFFNNVKITEITF